MKPVKLFRGDCLEILEQFKDNVFDACITDPPYHLQSIHKRFAARGRDETSERYAAGPYGRHATGFMGQKWDGGDIAFRPETWAEVYRVLKPGAHMCVFGGTRTFHRLACAIEDADFEIRDAIMWHYGSGFPKSHDVSKAIDRAAGAEREIVGKSVWHVSGKPEQRTEGLCGSSAFHESIGMGQFITAPATDSARQWDGWGTALKPATEIICLARKPFSEGTVAANVLKWGTGALNIDGCRIHSDDARGGEYTVKRLKPGATLNRTGGNWRPEEGDIEYNGKMKPGRWPANVCHDGSDEVLAEFPESSVTGNRSETSRNASVEGTAWLCDNHFSREHLDSGSSARFFYCAKASKKERQGSKHPTVKPIKLLRWLVRLITPPGGIVLDPFAGTGTTAEATLLEKYGCVLIEKEPQYQTDIEQRLVKCR